MGSVSDEDPDWKDLYLKACSEGRLDDVKLLVSKDGVLPHLGIFGAVKNGHLNVVRYLVEEVGVPPVRGTEIAERCGHDDIFKYLISKDVYPLDSGLPDLGMYKILGHISSGGFGSVDTVRFQSGLKLARKTVATLTDKQKKVVEEEINLLILLKDSKQACSRYLVCYYGAKIGTPETYIFMEYLDGDTLLYYFALYGEWKVGTDFMIRALYSVAKGIRLCHSLGVAHRDVKPENIVSDKYENGNFKMIDFGLSCMPQPPPEGRFRICGEGVAGTPLYLPPESLLKQEIRLTNPFAGDIWAFGVTLYYAVYRKRPYAFPTLKALRQMFKEGKAPSYSDEIPKSVNMVIKQCLKYDPSKRPTGDELVCLMGKIQPV